MLSAPAEQLGRLAGPLAEQLLSAVAPPDQLSAAVAVVHFSWSRSRSAP